MRPGARRVHPRWIGGTRVAFGKIFDDTGQFIFSIAGTAGRCAILLGRTVRQFRHFFRNLDKFTKQVFTCAIMAMPVVTLTGLFAGMIIAGQTGAELKRFGVAKFAMGPIVGASVVRELGPLLTAICVAGFVGGGMSSLVATMRVNEEIDALEVMAIDPVRFLVMPRLAAMIVAMPILTIYSDVIGILGGAIVSRHQVDVSYTEFYDMMRWALALRDVAFGLIKAVIFGVIITIVSCEQGFSAKGGAEGVGKATMRSVVYSFLLILIANFLLFSLVYRTIFTRIWN